MLQRQKNKNENSRGAARTGFPGSKFARRIRDVGISSEAAPAFGILSGACGLPKAVGISGDNHICRKLTRSTYVVAVADGMAPAAWRRSAVSSYWRVSISF